MVSRNIRTEQDREALIRLINQRPLPMSVSIAQGATRSIEQNRLQRLWVKEIAEQIGETAEYWRGYCKLRFGVPIRKRDDEQFAESYDRLVKDRYSYEEKIEIMCEPCDMPVTRDMTVAQLSEYLDTVHKHFAEQGVVLTQPDPRIWAA